MEIEKFTGGIFDTNAFLFGTQDARLLVDAPDGVAGWLRQSGHRVATLLITHGHVDHVLDAARVKREHACQVVYHPDSVRMLTEPEFFRKLGFGFEIEPIQADVLQEESNSARFGDIDFQVLHVPGHCPGSICFLAKNERVLFGGDVLFAGGVGRWDLPGGDYDLLMQGIREKVLPLGDDVKVLPGHGPATTVGRERTTNPFVTG